MLADLRGDRTVRDCQEYGIAETLSYQWCDTRLARETVASAPGQG